MARLTLPVVHTRVFGTTSSGGNPCPIVFEADPLTPEQMQSIAARFQSETAFVMTPNQAGSDLHLCYFVPQHEMEICVHATVGTVTVLVTHQCLFQSPIRIETSRLCHLSELGVWGEGLEHSGGTVPACLLD